MALLRFCKLSLVNVFKGQPHRFINTTPAALVKEIKVEKTETCLEISGENLPSPREPLLLKEVTEPGKKFCPKCTLGLDIKHTDVLILSQYLRSDGCILPRRVTGLCNVQQKRIGTLIKMAQKSGLMPNIAPHWSKRDPKKRYQWKKFNKYYDETTITYAKRRID